MKLKGKLKQVMVQYACRTTAVMPLRSSDENALMSTLNDLNQKIGNLFQSYENPQKQSTNDPVLLRAIRQYPIGSQIITVPSFYLAKDSVGVILLTRISTDTTKLVENEDPLLIPHYNTRIQSVLTAVQNSLKLNYNRAGKIYELGFGPFLPEEKATILESLLGKNDPDVGEMQRLTTHYKTVGNESYNLRTEIMWVQNSLQSQFNVNVKIDINNRSLKENMDPNEIKTVWEVADSLIKDHLDLVLPFEIN